MAKLNFLTPRPGGLVQMIVDSFLTLQLYGYLFLTVTIFTAAKGFCIK